MGRLDPCPAMAICVCVWHRRRQRYRRWRSVWEHWKRNSSRRRVDFRLPTKNWIWPSKPPTKAKGILYCCCYGGVTSALTIRSTDIWPPPPGHLSSDIFSLRTATPFTLALRNRGLSTTGRGQWQRKLVQIRVHNHQPTKRSIITTLTLPLNSTQQ